MAFPQMQPSTATEDTITIPVKPVGANGNFRETNDARANFIVTVDGVIKGVNDITVLNAGVNSSVTLDVHTEFTFLDWYSDNGGVNTVSYNLNPPNEVESNAGELVAETVDLILPDKPSASITSHSRTIYIVTGSTVKFKGSTSGGYSPLSYSWNFGGGASNSSSQNPSVIFNAAGTYTVTLTVTDAGSETSTETIRVIVINYALASSTTVGSRYTTLSLASSADLDITQTKWEITMPDNSAFIINTDESGPIIPNENIRSADLTSLEIWLPPLHTIRVRVRQAVGGSFATNWSDYTSLETKGLFNSYERYLELSSQSETIVP